MRQLIKSDVDNAIRLVKKYFSDRGDIDYLPAYHEALREAFDEDKTWCDSILVALTMKSYHEPYSSYYKVLSIFFEIVEEE